MTTAYFFPSKVKRQTSSQWQVGNPDKSRDPILTIGIDCHRSRLPKAFILQTTLTSWRSMAQDAVAEPSLKRPSSSQSPLREEPVSKRAKRPYLHHHKLQQRVQTDLLPEPAIPDDATVTHLLNRSIGQVLSVTGYEHAEPTALDAFRRATEECMLK